jgi:hypothetical protein
LLFINEEQRSGKFHAERLSASRAVSLLVGEYISQQVAQEGQGYEMFNIFSDMVIQAQSYRISLTPDVQVNAEQVRMLITQIKKS